MDMEHRCGGRRSLDLTVLVRRRGWGGSVVARVGRNGVGLVFDHIRPAGLAPLFTSAMASRAPESGRRAASPGNQADLAAGAAARDAAEAGTSGTGSRTQLPDSRRAGHGIE